MDDTQSYIHQIKIRLEVLPALARLHPQPVIHRESGCGNIISVGQRYLYRNPSREILSGLINKTLKGYYNEWNSNPINQTLYCLYKN
ncbi:hypothetical protein HNY73_010534 [Argiope bruennichi]|uniref:Uncharacterized protein n=1 Tax=Argiope bruennichi TaxID=94029 RepID=A0A8T0F1F2_ARGBR|nr:hypothetical protein HNY73_010534 [Argiope bruennichi]